MFLCWIIFTRSVISAGLEKRALSRKKGARRGGNRQIKDLTSPIENVSSDR